MFLARLLTESNLVYAENLPYADRTLTIYISQRDGTDEQNEGSDRSKPIRTLTRAYEIAKERMHDYEAFKILLHGGETFNDYTPVGVDLYGNGKENTYAFVWDIDRKLTISTYGSSKKAHLYGGKHEHEGGPVQAMLIIAPSAQEVLIENLYFEMWEVGTIMLFDTEDVHIRNIRIDKVGPYFFPNEQVEGVYCAGVIYPKNSTRVLIEDVVMTNCHNNYEELGALHGFYCTRLSHSEIRNCYLKNVSGSPFKFRRSPANNVYVHDNACYYTGVSTQTPDQVQFGFVRYSGDKDEGCPYALTFENNIFHYPYCWEELGENCSNAKAVKYSISNTTVCGDNACEDTLNVRWIDNDFKYAWEPEPFPANAKELEKDVKILERMNVDSVPADFPVGFSSLTKGDLQFIAYYNKQRYMTVASRKVTESEWKYKMLPSKVGWDSHNRIAMAFDRNGCLHVSGNMHNDTLTYFKTKAPFDISTFQKVFPLVSVEDEVRCTYPSFLTTPDGQVIFSYRLGGSGNGITITSVYDENTNSFKRLSDKPLFDGLNQMSAYASGPRLGPDGYYHLTWLWRDTPHCETNHDPSYARSKDLVNWETIDGTKLELPITPRNTQFTIDAVPPGGGVINGAYRLFFDEHQNPVGVYMKYDDNGNNQLFVAKGEGGQWHIKQVSNWDHRWDFKGPGSITFKIRIRNVQVANNTIRIEYMHKIDGDGELIIDAKTLLLLEDKKIETDGQSDYPEELMKAQRGHEGMTVHWMKMRSADPNSDEYYGLRWETLGKRRFYKPPDTPVKPSVLELIKFSRE